MTSQTTFVADNVRAEMARAKLTQAALADVLNVTQQAISAKLTGQTAFSVADLVTIADHLHRPLSVFFDIEHNGAA